MWLSAFGKQKEVCYPISTPTEASLLGSFFNLQSEMPIIMVKISWNAQKFLGKVHVPILLYGVKFPEIKGKSILQVPDTGTQVLDNTRPFWHSSIVCFWMPLAHSSERKYHVSGQYWYTRNIPVFTNTGTFQYLGPKVYYFRNQEISCQISQNQEISENWHLCTIQRYKSVPPKMSGGHKKYWKVCEFG